LSDECIRQMNNPPIFLQYVGYGYAKRGCPEWLVQGLYQWKTNNPVQKILTMFHEVYGSGPPWTSSFWLGPLQKKLVYQLVKISDQCITSNQYYADLIQRIIGRKLPNITVIPIFSNIGEPKHILPLSERSKRIVVFGHRNSRSQVYQKCQSALETVCSQLNIEEIYDIGVPTGLDLSSINGIPILQKGITEATEISQILQDSIVGFLNFPLPKYLAKSGVFSAFCSHGVIPCMKASSAIPIDNIESGKHYWSCEQHTNPLNLSVGQEIANHAYLNYKSHNLAAQSKIFATYIGVSN
jgi:hypothetical protein